MIDYSIVFSVLKLELLYTQIARKCIEKGHIFKKKVLSSTYNYAICRGKPNIIWKREILWVKDDIKLTPISIKCVNCWCSLRDKLHGCIYHVFLWTERPFYHRITNYNVRVWYSLDATSSTRSSKRVGISYIGNMHDVGSA